MDYIFIVHLLLPPFFTLRNYSLLLLVLTYFPAIMKQSKNEKIEPDISEENVLFLQRLRDESSALNKLIKKLEERGPSKPKPAENDNPKD